MRTYRTKDGTVWDLMAVHTVNGSRHKWDGCEFGLEGPLMLAVACPGMPPAPLEWLAQNRRFDEEPPLTVERTHPGCTTGCPSCKDLRAERPLALPAGGAL